MAAQSFHLHLVSDATGETVSAIARACLVQFKGIEPVSHLWWLVRTQRQIDQVLMGIEANPGIVLATLIDTDIRRKLEEGCRERRIPFIPVLDPVMAALSGYLHTGFTSEPGRQHALDAEYFRRIDAMQFTLSHDDGQLLEDLNSADVILVGVSRTSKTPTCMYLANRGIKAANVPLIPGVDPPQELMNAQKPLIIGLVREPKSLAEMRQNRLNQLNRREDDAYADLDNVREEVTASRRLFTARKWPVIDVTKRSIEEASAAIMQLYGARSGQPVMP